MFFTKPLRFLSSSLVNLQRIILFVSLSLIVIGLTMTVVMRYIVKTDISGFQELLLVPSLWLYFIGASYGSYEKDHIKVDLIETYVTNEIALKIIQLFTTSICLVASIIMTYWTYEHIVWTYQIGKSSSYWGIHEYIPHSSLLVGLILMTIYIARDFIMGILAIVKKDE